MTRLRSFSGLKWVGSEINETIRKARDALEEYVEGGGETAVLGPCIEHLTQVRGVLEMLQLVGPARLADEMQVSAKSLQDEAARHPEEAAEALMLSMIQLPDYLEKLESGGEDIPVLLLPAINDLRISRNAATLSDVDLVVSGMVHKSDAVRPGKERAKGLRQLALEVRPRLHKGLLNWFRGASPEEGIKILRDVFSELEAAAAGEALLRGVFRTTHAVAEGLLDQSIESSTAVKGLVGRVDRVVKQLADHGVEAAISTIEQAVIKDLLRQLVKAQSSNRVIRAVQIDYGLDTAFPGEHELNIGRRRMQALNADVLGGIRAAAVKELLPIKDTLDLYMRGGREQVTQLSDLEGPMVRLASTLDMTGLADLAQRLRDRAADLKSIATGEASADDTLLMGVAGDLLYVELSLDNLVQDSEENPLGEGAASSSAAGVPQGELRTLIIRTLDEAAVDMAKAKEAIVVYIDNPGDPRPLETTPPLFHGIAGALRVISRENAADVLDRVSAFVQQVLLRRSQSPEMHTLDALADAITGIEYYMEAVAEDRSDTDEILSIANSALLRLTKDVAPLKAEESPESEVHAEASLESMKEVDELRSPAAEDVAVPDEQLAQTDQIDPEILEIFLEEAREEEPIIQEYYQRWRNDPEDIEALATFRRSFHTLKGSGRLVGAMTIGDFSWSVESLLNRIIDQTYTVTDETLGFLDQAVARVSELIDAQEQGRSPSFDVEAFVARGQQIESVRQEEDVKSFDSLPLQDEVDASEDIAIEVLGEDEFSVEDSELRDIFQTEALEHLSSLQTFLTLCSEQSPPFAVGDEVVRSLHTLAGSARMTGLDPIAIVAKALERKASVLSDSGIGADGLYVGLLRDGVGTISSMVEHLSHPANKIPDTDSLLQRIEAYVVPAAGEEPSWAGLDEGEPIELIEVPEFMGEMADDAKSRLPEDARELDQDSAAEIEGAEVDSVQAAFTSEQEQALNAAEWSLKAVTSDEATQLESDLAAFSASQPDDDDLALRELSATDAEEHGLEEVSDGIAEQVAVPASAEAIAPEEPLRADLIFTTRNQDEAEAEASSGPEADTWLTTQKASDLERESADEYETLETDPELLGIFLEEADELLDHLDGGLRGLLVDPSDQDLSSQLQRTLHTLKGGARLAGIQSIGNLSHALETLVRRLDSVVPEQAHALVELAQQASDKLMEQIAAVRQGDPVPVAQAMISSLETGGETAGSGADSQESIELVEAVSQSTIVETVGVMVEEDVQHIEGDRELIEIFLEEAEDLLDQLDGRLRAWEAQPEDIEAPVQLKRTLHTLKGGARLANIPAVGDLSHALETLLEGVTPDMVRKHASLLPLAQRAADRLAGQVESIRESGTVQTARELVSELEYVHEELLDIGDSGISLEEVTAQPLPSAVLPTPVEPSPSSPAPVKTARPQPVQEQVRVRSDLLNRLVNNAGEISIYRARLEQQNTTLGFNLGELEQTVVRLHDQLRQMEIETEAQILYRYEQEREEGKDPEDEFDPLELDRFSTIQQLSRSLIETVNDLSSIKNLLDDQQKESETLLLQHSRISNDLQDGLLRTRMVPFSHLVPRLHRLVRQTSDSLNKRAMLEVIGGEGEMDRSILDRMLAPMEHILRNAISHGIESLQARRSAGKDEVGRITIYLNREGNDVVITVSDDGAGLNLDAIRRRAIESGLLESGAKIKDDDLMQLVLEPGFSTVKEVTQISGRGVGTDVVVSEVKQMGGSLEIESQPGRGTSFSIRLPFTLAISEALLVELGDEVFAVPHPTIEGVVRINGAELARCYEGTQKSFQYAGHDYDVRYLGNLLGILAPNLSEGRKWLPLLLVRSGEHRVAIQIDKILGNRQIVVKSVGLQLSSVRWISGGTILADGRVALILDVSALVRMDVVHSTSDVSEIPEDKLEQQVKVMVVDDSITVRKVTTRLLKRHNMEVITAKDGVDAVAQLQEQRPDIMLLDIEMPRMDGYELARHMRNSEALSDIPIIMITSRSGDKHRNLALSLGVKRYLGKPYQETDLLDNIYAILAESEVGV